MQRALTASIFILAGIIGFAAFLYPFLLQTLPELPFAMPQNQSQPSLLILAVMIGTLAGLLLEVQGQSVDAKTIAALGVLVAAASVLRFIEVAIPGPGGFSPIFVPIIIAGYVFGARFGFLMGTLTLLVSALLTGGIGPWLPYQMFTAGWVGLTAGLIPHVQQPKLELTVLVVFSILWGFLYGLVMNLYFWPYIAGNLAGTGSEHGLSGTLAQYGAYYIATSSLWDFTRAAGNAVLMAAVGLPTVAALERFRDRFQFQVLAE